MIKRSTTQVITPTEWSSWRQKKMNLFKNLKKKYQTDRILGTIIHKDVQSMLLPLNVMQFTTLCPKYCIKNNCISPNSIVSTFITFITVLLFDDYVYLQHFNFMLHIKLKISFVYFLIIIFLCGENNLSFFSFEIRPA